MKLNKRIKMNTLEILKTYKNDEVYTKKLSLNIEVHEITNLIPEIEKIENEYLREKLLTFIKNGKIIKYSTKKAIATEKATEARTKKAKEKIQNAINILRLENKKITHYSIAKTADVSYVTVKKYITLDEMNVS